MTQWALRSLFDDRGGLVASIVGVAVAFLLALFLEAIYAGEAEQMVAYPLHAGADVWVMQKGVANMHMATSLVGRSVVDEIRATPGVAGATPILYLNTFLVAGGKDWFTYVVGLERDASRGGPWAVSAGRERPDSGEAIVSDVLARQAGIGLGDSVRISGRVFTVVGLSSGTWSMANTVTFTSYTDLADILSAPQAASYILVEAEPGMAPDVLASRLRERVRGINALDRDSFSANDGTMARQMGGDIIGLMTVIGSLIGALVVAFAVYAAAARRGRELAIVKALGARNRRLYAAVLLQTLVVTGLGYGIAASLTLVCGPAIHAFIPSVTLAFSSASVARLGVIALVVAFGAALLPARRMAVADPASVFGA